MAEYFNVTTNLGDAEVANAIATNTKIEITHIAFGDGNGSVPTPSKSRTALVREVHRQAVTKYERHDTNPNWIVIETVIPSDVGGFTVREIGVIGNGKLISHGNHAPFEKVADPSGVSEYRLKFTQNITDGNVVSITLDESLIFATQAWVEENYIKRSEIIDNLTTNDATKPASAKQVKVLQDNKLGKTENAATATKLANARNLNGSSFDGTSNINIPALVTYIGSRTNLNDLVGAGFYRCDTNTVAGSLQNSPTGESFSLLVEQHAGSKQTLTEYSPTGHRTFVRNYYGVWGAWVMLYSTGNTTVDSNGFIKRASPILELYADHIELNDEASLQNITFEKLGTGDYLIKNTSGLAQEGWYIEQPKDANSNVYHAVIYEQLENGDLSIRTYENKLDEVGRIVADIEKPVDVKEGRFIAIRLNELPTDPTAPNNPTIVDINGKPAPSKYHVLDNGAWMISEEDETKFAQDKRSLLPKLSKRQFALYMYDHQMYDQVMQAIESNPRFKIEYDAVSDIERLSPTVSEMTSLLGWTEEQVDQMWAEALTL